MQAHLPKITIGITAYNCQDTIEAAVKSAANQNYPNLEIIVVDDCSSDGTQEKLKELQKTYEMKVFFLEINSGVAVARNRIVDESEGEFIAFFDDDDTSHPDRIQAQLSRILEAEGSGSTNIACYTDRIQVYTNGSEFYEPGIRDPKISEGFAFGKSLIRWALLGRYSSHIIGSAGTGTLMTRKKTFASVGLFDPQLRRGEDIDFLVRLAIDGGKAIGATGVPIRQKMNSTADKSTETQMKSHLQLIEKHAKLLRQFQLYNLAMSLHNLKFYVLKGAWPRVFLNFIIFAFRYPLELFSLFGVARMRLNSILNRKRLLASGKS